MLVVVQLKLIIKVENKENKVKKLIVKIKIVKMVEKFDKNREVIKIIEKNNNH